MIQEIFHSNIFLLTLTVAVYYLTDKLYKRWKFVLLNPLLVSMIIIICILTGLDIDFEEYYEANSIINFMLGLSVVALAYLLEQNINYLKSNIFSILMSVFIGSLVAIVSVWGIAYLLGADEIIIASLKPKSVTTPIAITITENLGGIQALTALSVILAGIFGSIIGPWLLKIVGVQDRIAKGLALGTASHAIGTTKAMEMGAVEGAVGGAAIAIAGVMTAILIPIANAIFSFF